MNYRYTLQWAPYPFIRITLSFIAGILLYVFTGKEFRYSLELFVFFMALCLTVVLVSLRQKTEGAKQVAGITGLLCFVAAGMAVTHLHTAPHYPQHLHNLATPPSHYVGTVSDYVVQKPGYQTTVLHVEQVLVSGQWQPATGRVQLSVPHDSEQAYEVSYGDRLLVKGAPQAIAPSANPKQFDYKAFLENKNIFHRHYLQRHQFEKIAVAPPNILLAASILLRRRLDAILREQVTERREYGISSALVLGVKDELDNAVRTAYASTGTMHVLAVSGLHVGLIYLLLMYLPKRIPIHSRVMRWSIAAVVVSVLWLYAFITGLSPSVLRAVIMFSIVTIAQASTRRSNIYNTIAFAAFALLFYNPYNLFEVSFQLSFIALLGIVYLQPKLYRLLELDNWWLNKGWQLFTVAVAAQLATFPLGVYYFHQFPVYFWVANVLVVPAAMFTLWSGVAALAFSWVPLLGSLLFQVHFWLIYAMNEFNLYLTNLPHAVLNGFSISLFQTYLLYVFLLLLVLFMARKHLRYLQLAVLVLALLVQQQVVEYLGQKQQRVLSFYSVRGATAISFAQGQEAVLLSDAALEEGAYTYNIQPHLWHLGIQQPHRQALQQTPSEAGIAHVLLPDSNSLYVWQSQRLLVIHKPLQVQPTQRLAVDYILLTKNVRLKPEDLQPFDYRHLLLDASNSPWHLQRLRQQLDAAGKKFTDLAADGALVVELGKE